MGLNFGEQKLLTKFKLTLNCLDYGYIKRSRNIKELENILLVLRSGEEGTYPDLVKFCENSLRELSPQNRLLQAQKSVVSFKDLPHDEQKILNKDLLDWEEKMKECSKSIEQYGCSTTEKVVPPIRNTMQINLDCDNEKKEKSRSLNQSGNVFQSIRIPRSYGDWEKFDVETELKKMDTDEENKKEPEMQSNLNVQTKDDDQNKTDCIKDVLQPYLDTSGLTEKEKFAVAEKEKIKGNEAFKVKDYAEAEVYYSRSISIFPTVAALNNRAFTNFKLKQYSSALFDCNTVLSLEPDNVKALYRRGLINKETGKFQLAYMDFSNALELEPENKAAKEQLEEVAKTPFDINPKNVKNSVIIEEIHNVQSSCSVSQPEPIGITTELSTCKKSEISCKNIETEKNSLNRLSPQTVDFLNVCRKDIKAKETNNDIGYDCKAVKVTQTNSLLPNKSRRNTDFQNEEELIKKKCLKDEMTLNSVQKYRNTEAILASGEPSISQPFPDGKQACSAEDDKKLDLKKKKPVTVCYDKEQSVHLKMQGPEANVCISRDEITPFKFLTLWHSMNANIDGDQGAIILKKLLPEQLPTVISNKLDGDLLCGLIRAMTSIVHSGDVVKGYKFLSHLLDVPRIKTVLSFLSSIEKKEIEDLLTMLKKNEVEHFNNLEELFLSYTNQI